MKPLMKWQYDRGVGWLRGSVLKPRRTALFDWLKIDEHGWAKICAYFDKMLVARKFP